MSRIGKIARLPREVREQLNYRLEEGALGVELVDWLNKQRAVKAVLKVEFGGREISEQNLSEWRQGGFVEWQKHREALAYACELAERANDVGKQTGGSLADTLSPLLAARYLAILESLPATDIRNVEDWKRLRELGSELAALRKADHSAGRLKVLRDR